MAKSREDLAAELDDQAWSLVDEAVERLEDSWQAARPTNLAEYVPPESHALRQRVLLELIKVDQEFHWRAGRRRPIEDYLADWPELAGQPDVLVELVEAECATRAAFDVMPATEELRTRFSEVADRIDLAAIAAHIAEEARPCSVADAASIDTSKELLDQTQPAGPAAAPLAVGQSFGRDDRYEIRELLGQGGMGTVYRAYDRQFAIEVALKIPRLDPSDPAVRERFRREAQTAVKIRHPNICRIFDAGQFGGTFYITMDLIEGQSLADWLLEKGDRSNLPERPGECCAQIGPVPFFQPQAAARLVAKLARALAAVHAEGIVHRDIKPSNVMIDPAGEPLLMDFGLARLTADEADAVCPDVSEPNRDREGAERKDEGQRTKDEVTQDPSSDREGADTTGNAEGPLPNGRGSDLSRSATDRLTHTGSLLGTLQYMSPEQALGQPVDARGDVYSLGVVFCQLLTGRLPFEGAAADVLESVRRREPPRPGELRPGLDRRLEAICVKAMAKSPADRYDSAAQFADAIEAHLWPSRRVPLRVRLRKWLAATAAATVAMVLGVLVYVNTGQGTIIFHINEPGATVFIDDGKSKTTLEGSDGDIVVDVGRRTVTVTKDGFRPQVISILLFRGGRKDVTVVLAPLPNIKPERWIETPPRAAGVSLSRDGTTLAVCFSCYPKPSKVEVYDVASGKTLQSIVSPNPYCDHKGIALSGDGRYVYVTNYFRRVISRIDLRDHNRRDDLPTGGVPTSVWATCIGITPNRTKLVVDLGGDGRPVDENNDQVSIVDVADGQFNLLGQVLLDDEPNLPPAFSADSRFAYLATAQRKSPGPTLYEVSLTPPFEVIRRLVFPGGELKSVAVSDRLHRVFVSDPGNRKIWVVDLKRFKAAEHFSLGEYDSGTLTVNDTEGTLYVLSPESRKLFLLDAAEGAMLARVDGLRRDAAGMELSPDNRELLVWHRSSEGGVAVINVGRLRGGIVFASDRAGESYQIYRMQPGDQESVRLTRNEAENRCPRWSPDGRRIAYLSKESGLPRICVTDCFGAKSRVLETDPEMPRCGAPFDWSPDGKEIAFIGDKGRAIRIIDVDTGAVRKLIEGPLGDGYAWHLTLCWRRADGHILVNSQSPASFHDQGIFLLDPRTRHAAVLPMDIKKPAAFFAPVSSPDGKRIAVLQSLGDDRPAKKIFLVAADGTAPDCLVDDYLVDDALNWLLAVRWHADGKHLIYSAVSRGRAHVSLVDTRTKKSISLTSGDWNDIEPDICGDVDMDQAGSEKP